MTSTEKDRLDLRQEFERIFANKRIADIAMEALPPIDYTQLATKQDVANLGTELRGEIAELRGEIAELRGEFAGLQGDFAGLQGDFAGLRGEFAGLEAKVDTLAAELRGEMAGLRGEMAELRGETRALIGAMDTRLANSVRLLVGSQIATVTILGGWLTAVA